MADNYFQDRDRKNLAKLRELRDKLPAFCREYFVSVSSRFSVLTRLAYARDLLIFFDYLCRFTDCGASTPSDFTLEMLDQLKAFHIEEYMDYLSAYEYNGTEYHNGPQAKLRKVSSVRSLFKYLYSRDYLSENVASKVMAPSVKEHEIIRLEREEMERLLDEVERGAPDEGGHGPAYRKNVSLRDTAIVSLLLGTGIRISECVGLNVDDVDFESLQFTITRKGGKRTILYLPQEVAEVMKAYLEERLLIRAETDAFFLSLQQKRINVRTVQKMVKMYASCAVPMKTITPHKLRSTFGTNLYRETKDIYIVAEVLGHSDVNTTKRHYAAISEDIKRSAAGVITLRSKKNTPPEDDEE